MGSKKRTRKKYLALALALLLVSVFALVFIWSLESDSNMLNRYLTPFNSLTGASVGFPDEAIASSSEVSLSGEVSLSAVPTITAVTLTATSALNRTSDNLSASVSGLSAGTNVTYNWYLNGASITVLNMPMTNASWSPDAQTTYDFSGYNNNGTLGTNLLADVAEPNYTTSCVIGGCYIFDGRNDTINVGNASNLNFAANESFSISVWFKAAAFTTGDHLIDKRGTSGPGYSLGTGSIAASTLDFNVWGASGSPQASKTGLSANQWYHAVGVRDTASDRIFLYVNGVLAENTADSTTGHINSTNSVTIGSRVDQSAGFFFNGSIDEVRIYRRALSEAQIKALYNSESTNYANNLTVEQEILPGEAWNVSATPIDFQGQNGTTYFSTNLINIAAINNTAPSITSASLSPANPTTSDNLTSTVSGLTDANGDSTNVTYNWYVNGTSITVLNLPFTYHMFSSNETYTNDFSGNGNDGVIGYNGRGDPLEPQFNRDCAIGGCYTFDGVNDFISAGNASNLNFAANESFSISVWFKAAAFTTGDHLIDKRGTSGPGYSLGTGSIAASTLDFNVWGASGSPQASKTGLSANQWYHAVGVRDTASDRIFLYVNGVLAENTADSTTGHINSTNSVTIGSRVDQSAGFFFNGSIDEVRIYRRALSEAQIKALYNSESTNYANNLTVEQEILPGEAWNVSATPIDFQGQNGTTYFSTNLINIAAINNTAPSITSASLSPANPTTSDNLTSTVSGLTDANGDSTNVTYNWYVNGTSITVLNLPFTYHMFSSNETYTNDFSGNGNDGVIGYNGRGDPLEPQFNRDCAIGGCYTFDGVNDFISVGNASNLNFAANESFSISLWFNSAKFSVGDYLLDKRGASGPGYFLATDSAAASTLNFDVVGASGSPQASKTGLSANQWYYAVGVRDTASDRIFLYVNGILAENTADSTTGHINSTNPVTIGSRTDQSAGFFFNGSIDEVRIYRRALTSQEVAALNLSESINHTNNIMVLNETLAGDIWNATATPIDSNGQNGSTLWTQRVRINDTLPVIVLYLPVNATNFASFQPVIFNFTVIDDYDTIFDCNLTLNSVTNQTNSSVNNNTVTTFNISITSGDSYNWSISCADSFHTNTSETRFFFFVTNTIPNGMFVNATPVIQYFNLNVTFFSNWTEPDAEDNVSMYLCKDASCTNCDSTSQTNCWCSSPSPNTQPDTSDSCVYTITTTDSLTNNFWLGVCDSVGCDLTPLTGGNFTAAVFDLFLSNTGVNITNAKQAEVIQINTTLNLTGNYNLTNINLSLFIDSIFNSSYFFNLTFNTSSFFQFNWSASGGNHTLLLAADPLNSWIETNETNNNATINSTVNFVLVLTLINPANNSDLIRGKDSNDTPYEDGKGVIADTVTVLARVSDLYNDSRGFAVNCTIYFNQSYVSSALANSTGHCSYALNKVPYEAGIYNLTVNFTDLPGGTIKHTINISSTTNHTITVITMLLDPINEGTNGRYMKGEASVLNVTTYRNGELFDPSNITLNATTPAGALLRAFSYPGNMIRKDTGLYGAVYVVSSTGTVKWDPVYLYQDNTTLIGSGLHGDVIIEGANANLTIRVINKSATNVNTTYDLYDNLGYLLTEVNFSDSDFSYEVRQNKNHTVNLTILGGKTIIFDYLATNNTNNTIVPQIIDNYNSTLPSGIKNVSTIVAIDNLMVPVRNVTIYLPVDNQSISSIYKCTDWNFTSLTCNAWSAYSTSLNQNTTDFWFSVTGFSGYAGAVSVNSQLSFALYPSSIEIQSGGTATIYFNATYVNSTSGAAISTAVCSLSAGSTYANMSYDSSSGKYQYTGQFSPSGTTSYSPSVTCSATGYDTLTSSSSFTITVQTGGGASTPPAGGGEERPPVQTCEELGTCPKHQCNDDRDNDGDGKIDTSDPGCDSADDDSEAVTCGYQWDMGDWSQCSNGKQKRNATDSNGCEEKLAQRLVEKITGDRPILERSCAQCGDGADNDDDGKVDFPEDIGCESQDDNNELDVLSQCYDGLDNDEDGYIDYPEDYGCTDENDNDESEFYPQCWDAEDNDGDGRTDYPDDLGCDSWDDESEEKVCKQKWKCQDWSPCENGQQNRACWDDNACLDQQAQGAVDKLVETPKPLEFQSCLVTECEDGIDNDGDGLIDYPLDLGCKALNDVSEMKQCIQNWQCTEWTACKGGNRTRVCHDDNFCWDQYNQYLVDQVIEKPIPKQFVPCKAKGILEQTKHTVDVGMSVLFKKEFPWWVLLVDAIIIITISHYIRRHYKRKRLAKGIKLVEDKAKELDDFIHKAIAMGYKRYELEIKLLQTGWKKEIVKKYLDEHFIRRKK